MATPGVTSSPSSPAQNPQRTVNPWLIAVTVTIAAFMELLDTSIANVALPYIGGGLGRSYDEVTWILTTYLVANAVVLPMTAWLSRLFGRKTYYLICVVLFTVSSLFCGLSPSLGFMLLWRIVQGVGGGGLAPVAQAILVDTFPPAKRAAAFALFTVVIVTAPAVGPVLGGWITDNYDWRWIFFINVPVGILSLYLSNKLIHDPKAFTEERLAAKAAGRMSIDTVGIMLITLASATLEVSLDRGQIDDWFGSGFITTMIVIAVLGWIATVAWESYVKDPIIDFGLLKNRNFAIASVLFFVFGVGLFGTTTLIPQMLQSLYGYRAIDAGLVLGPGALVITVLAPISAQLLQRHLVSAKTLIFVSLCFISLSMFVYSVMNLDTNGGALSGHSSAAGRRVWFLPGSRQYHRLFSVKAGPEQQGIKPDQSLPQLGWQLWNRLHHYCSRAAGELSSDEPRVAPGQQFTKSAAELGWNGRLPHAAWVHQCGRGRSIARRRVPAATSPKCISSLHGLFPRDWVADDRDDSSGLSHSQIQRRRWRVHGTLILINEVTLTTDVPGEIRRPIPQGRSSDFVLAIARPPLRSSPCARDSRRPDRDRSCPG